MEHYTKPSLEISIPFFATKYLKNMAMAVPPSIVICCNKRQSIHITIAEKDGMGFRRLSRRH
ncbi:unnamed protein product [Brassica rapa subsp. trilocularis]